MTARMIADDGKNYVDLSLISVEDRLPTHKETENGVFTFRFDEDGNLNWSSAFYCPAIGWIVMSKPDEKGECHFYDITKMVEYWAVVPDEFRDEFWKFWEIGDDV